MNGFHTDLFNLQKVWTMERGLGLVLELLLLATCVNTLTNAEKNILTGRCTLVSADSSANCAHLHLKSVPQNLPSGIRVLDLSDNDLSYLKNGSFELLQEPSDIELGQ